MLGAEKTENGTIHTSLSKGNAKITVSYTPSSKNMTVAYDMLAYKLDKTAIKGDNILPDPDSVLGTSMPSMIEAIKRMPDKETTDSTGKTIQTYSNFTDEDYNAFSIYLKSENCNVDGYSLDGSVMTIELSKNDNSFSFVYDREQKSAKVIYSQGARPKQVILATATPIPKQTPKPTLEPTLAPTSAPKNYSVSQCYEKAVNRLRNSLKNPTSLIVNGYNYSTNDGYYQLYIDYSAQNGFGGYNRKTYYCEVNWTTGAIQSEFSF